MEGNTFESNPQLAKELKSKGIQHIVAFGVQSECCVQETCKGALDEGFQATLLHGAHSTYDSEGRAALEIEMAVEDMLRTRGVRIAPCEDVGACWEDGMGENDV